MTYHVVMTRDDLIIVPSADGRFWSLVDSGNHEVLATSEIYGDRAKSRLGDAKRNRDETVVKLAAALGIPVAPPA